MYETQLKLLPKNPFVRAKRQLQRQLRNESGVVPLLRIIRSLPKLPKRCRQGLSIALLLLLSTVTPADTTPGGPSIVVLGDSISAHYGLSEADGWVELMRQALQADYPDVRVHNASISGDTTSGGLQRLPRALERFQPDIVIIELGGNDGLRGSSLKQMTANLQGMVDAAHSHGAQALILGMQIPSNYGPAYTEKFASAFVEVAETTGAALVPFLLAPITKGPGDRKYFQADGIHPTAEAQPLMLQVVLPELTQLLQSMAKP